MSGFHTIRDQVKTNSCGRALDDMEISNVQLRLENAAQADRIMAVDGNDRVAVAIILCGVQDRERVRENRIGELEGIGKRKEICHRGMADPGEIEHKVIACGKAAQRLVRRGCNHRVARRGGARILQIGRAHV